MKRRLIESTPIPIPPKGETGWWTEVQLTDDILILNVFKDMLLRARHAINIQTGEYATLESGKWKKEIITDAYGEPARWCWMADARERFKTSENGKELIKSALNIKSNYLIDAITDIEQDYSRKKRWEAEYRRIARVNALMDTVPDIPDDFEEFVDERLTGKKNWAIKGETGWICTHCGGTIDGKWLKKNKVKDRQMITCPHCGESIEYRSRKRNIEYKAYITLIQPIDSLKSVARHFKCSVICPGGKKEICIDEGVRIMLYKAQLLKKAFCEIWYKQPYEDRFDRRNPANRREGTGYLYDGGIEESFKGTRYEELTRLFVDLAAAGQKADFNRIMAAIGREGLAQMFEMLFRNRFYRLLTEESEKIDLWRWKYFGELDTEGKTMEEVFGIPDKQRINRIRDRNGGHIDVEWMRWSCRHNTKVTDKTLQWLEDNHIFPEAMQWLLCRMTPEQAMNYIERQKKESYQGSSTMTMISQYEDYMDMCQKLKKDTTDQMVFRPRELKRRHDECVMEMERYEANIKAEEYSNRYPEAEGVLKEIKDKFSYKGEEYFVKVPEKIIDIVLEGRFLHHCAGATDRYFDRIKDHETYICFLRKTSEPDTPFYTIEVEPGGTIRQHRGMFDEEPEIEKIKPFLREWQKEIRKRMKEEDHKRAARSEILREANIRELREKNNTRVLKGLEEDFMAAVV